MGGFNDHRKYAPPPRDITDQEALKKALEYELAPDVRRKFENMQAVVALGTKLSKKQRGFVEEALDEHEPRVANLVSRGLVKRGNEVETPACLRPENLPKAPPGRKAPTYPS